MGSSGTAGEQLSQLIEALENPKPCSVCAGWEPSWSGHVIGCQGWAIAALKEFRDDQF